MFRRPTIAPRRGFPSSVVGFAQRDVVAQLPKNRIDILQHEPDPGAQIGRIELAHVDAVDEDLPSCDRKIP